MKTNADRKNLLAGYHDVIKQIDDKVKVSPLETFAGKRDASHIYVDDSLSPKEVMKAVLDTGIHHLIQINQNYFVHEIKNAAPLVKDPEKYFNEEYLTINPDNVESIKIKFKNREEKSAIINSALSFVDTLKSNMVKQAATAIIEELYMNAVLDAPAEAEKKGVFKKADGPILFLAYNATHLQISCTDHYGSLELKKFVERVHEVYDKGAGESIRFEGNGGAGIGGFLLFENCSTLVVGVKPNEITKVTALIPLKVSYKVLCGMKKSIHGFEV